MSNDTAGDSPKPRSFADAAALLPSVVPVPRAKPAETPRQQMPPAGPPNLAKAGPSPRPAPRVTRVRAGVFAAAFPPGAELSSSSRLDGLLAGVAAFLRRRPWVLAVPLAAAGGFAALHGVGNAPIAAGSSQPAQASAPGGADASDAAKPEAGMGKPQPGPSPLPAAAAGLTAADTSPAQPAAPPPEKTAAGSTPATTPGAASVPYSLIVLHPRPASAAGDADNGRIAALLQPLAARIDVQKQAGTKGRLTVHYFHDEDAQAAKALADTVRTPGSRVHVRGPVRTRTPWPRNAFEVWLRGP